MPLATSAATWPSTACRSASTGDDHFTIVAHAGRGILAAGTTLPLVTSTQILAAARGTTWACGDFRREPTWAEPTDRLMLALGFRSGCSVPLRDDHGRVRGVVSASFLHPHGASDRRIAAVSRAAPLLSRLMRESGSCVARRPTVLVCVEDDVAAQGVARLAERAGGLVVGTPRTLATAVAHATSGVSVLVLDRRFDGQPAQAIVGALRAAGDVDSGGARAGQRLQPRAAGRRRRAGRATRRATAGRTRCSTPSRSPSRAPARRAARPLDPPPALTPREQQLLVHLERGVPFKQAAAALGIAESTSRWYARGLFRKLGATSRGDAVHRARRLGLL